MLPNGPDLTPTYIRNPLNEDFSTMWNGKPYTLHSKELMKYPKWLADHIGNQLVRKLALMESATIAWDIREKEAREKVFVTI